MHYRQKVLVIKGFYKGVKGRLVAKSESDYLLAFGLFKRRKIWVHKSEVAPVKKNPPK